MLLLVRFDPSLVGGASTHDTPKLVTKHVTKHGSFKLEPVTPEGFGPPAL